MLAANCFRSQYGQVISYGRRLSNRANKDPRARTWCQAAGELRREITQRVIGDVGDYQGRCTGVRDRDAVAEGGIRIAKLRAARGTAVSETRVTGVIRRTSDEFRGAQAANNNWITNRNCRRRIAGITRVAMRGATDILRDRLNATCR